MWYAQLNDDDVCFAQTDFAEEPGPNLRLIPITADAQLLGKKYDRENGVFLDPPPPIPTELQLLAHVDYVYSKFVDKGYVWNELPIRTDDASQLKYLAELAAINLDEREENDDWEFADDIKRSVSNADFKDLAVTARMYVRYCFGVKGYLRDLVKAETVTNTAMIEAVFKQAMDSLTTQFEAAKSASKGSAA